MGQPFRELIPLGIPNHNGCRVGMIKLRNEQSSNQWASYPALLLLLDPKFPVQLLQRDVACQDTSDCSRVLHTLVDHLLLLTLVAVLLHTEIKNFLCQAVEGGKVFIAEGEANVPVFWIGFCSVQEDAVVFN